MVRRAFSICCVLFFIQNSSAQIVVYENLTKLPSVINSPSEEVMPLLSPDGKKLYFSRALYDDNEGGMYAGQDIWVSDYSHTGWKMATNDLPQNSKSNNVVVGFGAKDNTMLYVDASPYRRMNGISFTKQNVSSGKIRPGLLAIPGLENMDFIGFYVSPDLDVIFLSMKGPESSGNEDLYYTTRNGTGEWNKPKSLGATINSPGYEISPFLSADKKRLYFSSNGHGGVGDADIFFSERLYDSWETWSVPTNLGTPVNSPRFDAYFSIHHDSVAFFSSNRDGKFADLYQVNIVKRKTILAAGQRYLTRDEWSTTVSKNVSPEFSFPTNTASLSPSQGELLFYIVNKLMLDREVRFHLVVEVEENMELSQKRLAAMTDELKKQGIDGSRIFTDQLDVPKKSNKGVIELRLFK